LSSSRSSGLLHERRYASTRVGADSRSLTAPGRSRHPRAVDELPLSCEPDRGFGIELSGLSGGRCLVALAGELDLAQRDELATSLALAAIAYDEVIVDLSELTFIDATGIGTLVAASEALHRNGGTMRLVAPRPNLERVFAIVRLSSIIPIEQPVLPPEIQTS
jgi:anti-anti-sigma factor